MCECIKTIESKLTEAMGGQYKGKPIKSINLNTVKPFSLTDKKWGTPKVAISYDIARENVKRDAKDIIVATFCPFCGVKYGEESCQL